MVISLVEQPLLLVASVLFGTSVFMMIRFPLLWWIQPTLEHELIQWDLDDNRRKLLRRESKLFKKLEPWIVGLANMFEHKFATPESSTKKQDSAQAKQRLRSLLLGSPKTVTLGLRTGVITSPWTTGEYMAAMGLLSLGIAICISFAMVGQLLTLTTAISFIGLTWLIYRVQMTQLERSIRARQAAIKRLLPHSLEILSMTMSAGGTFESGLEDVLRDFPSHPLSREFEKMIKELQRGVGMYDALRNIAERIQIVEFDDILRTMTISHEHGAPAADFFRRGAKQLRTKQLRSMEIAVGKAEAKMPLPTMVITVACMIIAIAPFVVGALESGILDMFQ